MQPQSEITMSVPHSLEAEEAVIGSVLINEFVFDELSDLQPADFYIHRLRFIWEAYQRLRERNRQFPVIGHLTRRRPPCGR